jgi:WD domain, G-beta repeat
VVSCVGMMAANAPVVALGLKLQFVGAKGDVGERGRVILWNVESNEVRVVVESQDETSSLALSCDGVLLAMCDGKRLSVRAVDVVPGREMWNDQTVGRPACPLAFSTDGELLAAGVGGEVRCFNARTGKIVRRSGGRMGDVMAVAFAPDGSRVVSGGFDPRLRVWDVKNARGDFDVPLGFSEEQAYDVRSAAFSSNSREILAFVPRFEKQGMWDRLSRQREVDSYEKVGALILEYSIGQHTLTPVSRNDLPFADVEFAAGARKMIVSYDFRPDVEVWAY